jgi:hypothetical protein
MHYVTHKSHRMQKHKFGVTCPGVLFVESIPVPPKHENSVNVSRRGSIRMPYMAHRSHRMQKHKFGVTCPGVLFVESIPVPSEYE